MKITAYYKYQASQSFFKEEHDDLTPEQAQQIEKRYSDNMAAGEYVALQIVIEREG